MKVSRFSTKKLERVMSEFWKENDELRELLAWRSAEAERPENGTFCLIILKNSAWPNVIQYVEGVLWNPEFITHWRPIGPLPELGCDNMEGESEKDEYAGSTEVGPPISARVRTVGSRAGGLALTAAVCSLGGRLGAAWGMVGGWLGDGWGLWTGSARPPHPNCPPESVVMYMNIVKHMWANSRLSNFGYDSMTDEMKRAFNRVVGKPIGDRNT